jgi:hypothetical protein
LGWLIKQEAVVPLRNPNRTLGLLDEYDAEVTFFVLG